MREFLNLQHDDILRWTIVQITETFKFVIETYLRGHVQYKKLWMRTYQMPIVIFEELLQVLALPSTSRSSTAVKAYTSARRSAETTISGRRASGQPETRSPRCPAIQHYQVERDSESIQADVPSRLSSLQHHPDPSPYSSSWFPNPREEVWIRRCQDPLCLSCMLLLLQGFNGPDAQLPLRHHPTALDQLFSFSCFS
jgi:hypothetical protein